MEGEEERNSDVRLGARILLVVCFPFLLIAVFHILIWICNNPIIFLSIWLILLLIGLVSNSVIEFDFHHGFGNIIPGYNYPAPIEETEAFWDAREGGLGPIRAGLVGQGEGQVDEFPSQLSTNTTTRSRPLAMLNKNIYENIPNAGNCLIGNRPCSPIPEIEESVVMVNLLDLTVPPGAKIASGASSASSGNFVPTSSRDFNGATNSTKAEPIGVSENIDFPPKPHKQDQSKTTLESGKGHIFESLRPTTGGAQLQTPVGGVFNDDLNAGNPANETIQWKVPHSELKHSKGNGIFESFAPNVGGAQLNTPVGGIFNDDNMKEVNSLIAEPSARQFSLAENDAEISGFNSNHESESVTGQKYSRQVVRAGATVYESLPPTAGGAQLYTSGGVFNDDPNVN